MRQGCCLGCIVIVLLAAAAGAGVYTLASRMGAFETYPPQRAASVLAANPAVLLKVNFQHPEARPFFEGFIGDSAGAWTPMALDSLPWEGVCALLPDRDAHSVNMVTALSLRRLAGLLESRTNADVWRWFAGQKVGSQSAERPGIWVVRSTIALRDEALAEAKARWSRPPGEPLPTPENALAVLSLDNRDGGAYLALETLLNPPALPGNELVTKPAPLDARAWAAYFKRWSTATGTLSFDGKGGLGVELHIDAIDEASARDLLALCELGRDRLSESIEAEGGQLLGQWSAKGTALSGTFTVRDGQRLIKMYVMRHLP